MPTIHTAESSISSIIVSLIDIKNFHIFLNTVLFLFLEDIFVLQYLFLSTKESVII